MRLQYQFGADAEQGLTHGTFPDGVDDGILIVGGGGIRWIARSPMRQSENVAKS